MHWKRPWVTVPMDYQVLITQGDRKQWHSVSRLFTQQHIGSFTWNYALFTWNSFCPLLTSWRWYPASCPQQSIWESSRRGGNQCGGTVGPLRGIPGEETRAKAAPLPPELSYHPPPRRSPLLRAEGKSRACWSLCVVIPCKTGKVTIGRETQAPGISPLGWGRGCFYFSPDFCTFFFCDFFLPFSLSFWFLLLFHFPRGSTFWTQDVCEVKITSMK